MDSTLGVTDGRALRARVEALGKPLLAVLITHAHPDHYGAVTTLVDIADVPVIATKGIRDVIRRDDGAKELILRPVCGDEWPRQRTFPSRVVRDGERLASPTQLTLSYPGRGAFQRPKTSTSCGRYPLIVTFRDVGEGPGLQEVME